MVEDLVRCPNEKIHTLLTISIPITHEQQLQTKTNQINDVTCNLIGDSKCQFSVIANGLRYMKNFWN